jgi:hypothetical protein
VLTLTSSTTAYSSGQLIASSATAGSIVVPSLTIATSGGGFQISRVRLSTNDSLSTSWPLGTQVQVDLWTAAPTVTTSASGTYTLGGDRLAWYSSIATGSAGHIASYSCTFSPFAGDGFYSECAPLIGNAPAAKLASGTSVFVTIIDLTASGTTTASKTMTVTAELFN